MNIVGENFPKKIVEQIKIRQEKKGALNRNPSGDPSLLVWQNSNTGWVKVISSVNITQERVKVSNKEMASTQLLDNGLARQYVLFGGVYNQIGKGNKSGLRSGIERSQKVLNNSAYGLGGLDYGILPMPGITSFSIKTETRGSLKTATIHIKAYNRQQFDIINTLYLSLGYSILIEWGNTMYYTDEKTFITENPYSLADEFLEGTYKWNSIIPKINKYRLESCGNYDAALGKVVNFSWTINRDLSYDIILTVRTIGDIIESLKMNTLSGYIVSKTKIDPKKDEGTPPAETSIDIIQSYAYTHDIGVLFNNIINDLQSNPKKTNDITINENDVVAVKINFEGNSKGSSYYIRFGYFLQLLEKNIIPKLKGTEQRMIEFDYEIDNNIITLYDRQLSANPTICIFQRTFKYTNSNNFTLFPELNQFTLEGSGGTYKSQYGKLMNVYFDMTYILDQLQNLKNNDGIVTLIDLLKSLSDGFNSATGNYNKISPTVNEDNKIVFIDDVPLPDKEEILKKIPLTAESSTHPAEFKMYGYYNTDKTAGMVRDLSLTTTISPNLATMITIGAQANGYITGQDSTALSTMNLGLLDRVKEEWVEPNKPENNTTSSSEPPLEVKYQDSISSLNKFIQSISKYNWNQEDIDAFSNSISSFAEYDQAAKILKERNTNPTSSSPNIGFLPFDLTLKIDGLSGMKVYQQYIADTEFLPSNYPQSLVFLIKGITHEIINNQWITTLESLAVPKNPFGKTDDFNVGSPTYGQTGPTERAQGASRTVRGVNSSDFIKNTYIPALNKQVPNGRKGIKLLITAQAQFEGYKPNNLAYRTNNPGNINNTDKGNQKFFDSLEQGIQAQYNHTVKVVTNKEPNYILNTRKKAPGVTDKKGITYPGIDFIYTGKLKQYLQIYATGPRLDDNYLNFIIGYFKNNGINITKDTTLQEIYNIV